MKAPNVSLQTELFTALDYKPHKGQQLLHKAIDTHRFVTAVCGRRFGKTVAVAHHAIYRAFCADRPHIYIVSDTYDHAKKVFNIVVNKIHRFLKTQIKGYNKSTLTLELKNGSIIQAKSADNPQSLTGDSVGLAIVDEAQFVTESAIELLIPSLAEREGGLVAIGTFERYAGWFDTMYQLGLSGEPGYQTLNLPTWANPHVPQREIERLKRVLPDRKFRTQIAAEKLTGDSQAFDLELIEKNTVQDKFFPLSNHTYIAGIDIADSIDYTAIVIVDISAEPHQVVAVERWNRDGSYSLKAIKIAEILKRWNNARAFIEKNNSGQAFCELLLPHYSNFELVTTTMQSKMRQVDGLNELLHTNKLKLCADPNLQSEIRSYQRVLKANGVSYSAPQGLHDDCVMALLLTINRLRTIDFPFVTALESENWGLAWS